MKLSECLDFDIFALQMLILITVGFDPELDSGRQDG